MKSPSSTIRHAFLPRNGAAPSMVRAAAWPSRTNLLAQTVDLLLGWQERRRQRRDLGGLDDRLLKDLGLSRADVEREVRKPFWRD